MDTDLYPEFADQIPALERVRTRIDHVSASGRIRGNRATSHQHRPIVGQLDSVAGYLRRTLAAGDADHRR